MAFPFFIHITVDRIIVSEKHKARKWDEEDPTCQESTPLLRNREKGTQ